MAKSKIEALKHLLLLSYLAIFPFGQIPALITTIGFHNKTALHISDILIFLYVFTTVLFQRHWFGTFLRSSACKFIVILSFSWLFGLIFFNTFYLPSLLYLLRICVYILFAYLLWRDKSLDRGSITHFIVVTALLISAVGFIQYVLLPDTRFLKIFGWDDHYYRLISTFLDPAYTGILLALSLLFMFISWRPANTIMKYASIAFVSFSLLLTYSRASYLALFVGFIVYILKQKQIRLKYIVVAIFFGLSLFVLPRPGGGEGVKLERTFSIFLKIKNSEETFRIFESTPVFGVGYNNLCLVKNISNLPQSGNLFSHSCAGADNSILFILSTLGVVGFLFIATEIAGFLSSNSSPLIFSLSAALFFHTQFTNTLFYPWVFVWIVLAALSEVEFKAER